MDEGPWTAGSGAPPENSNWDVCDVKDDCVRRLQAAGIPAEVVAVAEASERCFELGVYEHSATAPWLSKGGRAVLLGDAHVAILQRVDHVDLRVPATRAIGYVTHREDSEPLGLTRVGPGGTDDDLVVHLPIHLAHHV